MSLAKIAEVAREREVDLIIIAGDLFDAPIRNSDADSMPLLLDACGALLDAAPVVSVQGTPSHDAPGCYAPIVLAMVGRPAPLDAHRRQKCRRGVRPCLYGGSIMPLVRFRPQ